ncbi:MAG: hypothetical protein ACRD16_13295, partial [Thermoanaerobaculia bacterium]
VKVDFIFQGADVKTGAAISVAGIFVNDGGSMMRSFSDIRYDDFIDALVQKSAITTAQESDGVLGSMVLIYEGIATSNLASARARFFSSQFGGTIGVAVNGHPFTGTETTAVAGAFTDTRTLANTPQLYSNIFVTNFGKYVAGTGFVSSDDTVRISAFSSSTGQPLGTPLTVPIASFRTLSTSLSALGVPAGSGAVIVLAKATSGQGLLVGVGAEVDDATKDPSGFEMNAVPASSTGPTSAGTGGDLASQLAGNWTGNWTNNTFQTTGTVTLAITVNSSARTYSATVTLGGSVFGGSPPGPVTVAGNYSSSTGLSYSGHDALFGDLTFTISPAGAINGSATNIPGGNVSSLTFSGTATATTISITYTLTLNAGATATGVVSLTHS